MAVSSIINVSKSFPFRYLIPNVELFIKSLKSSDSTDFLIAASRAATISGDVPLGTAIPLQVPETTSCPNSFNVATSGRL